jgi:hypothetical protein
MLPVQISKHQLLLKIFLLSCSVKAQTETKYNGQI